MQKKIEVITSYPPVKPNQYIEILTGDTKISLTDKEAVDLALMLIRCATH